MSRPSVLILIVAAFGAAAVATAFAAASRARGQRQARTTTVVERTVRQAPALTPAAQQLLLRYRWCRITIFCQILPDSRLVKSSI